MLEIYHKVRINESLLKPGDISIDMQNVGNILEQFLKGHVVSTLPAGKVVGVTYNPYLFEKNPANSVGLIGGQRSQLPFLWSQTDISMVDSQKRNITEPTDISDYRHKGGGHLDGFKNIHMDNEKDAVVRIDWETIGTVPICGEFVFRIQQEDCECKV
ncbi:hypothetical protein [uncultured Tenacibaculum sp.]|uniref:hypothetical protein n=1 Tax=uncultured Tenacibaculum sp. TaxID=174713 RepID=UPI00262FDAB4|nr:hypothetical protein [uncultured Tenacibaculum sp.]